MWGLWGTLTTVATKLQFIEKELSYLMVSVLLEAEVGGLEPYLESMC